LPKEILFQYMREELGIDLDGVDETTLLFSTGLVDSFALVDLIAFIEEQFGFRVGAMDVNPDNFDSVERMLAYVERARS